MAIFSSLRAGLRRSVDGGTTQGDGANPASVEETKKDTSIAAVVSPDNATVGDNDKDDLELPAEDAQRGVHNVEAVTLSWSKRSLIAVFVNIWFLYLVNAFQSSVFNSLSSFVTSSYESHSLLNVIYVVADSISAATFLPMAKIMDTWGRAEGYFIMSLFCTLGLIMMAGCNSLATFCAAYTFYKMGFTGITYCVDVITADASKLKNRGLAYAFTSSPYIITAFAGPKVADRFYHEVSWRWGFGCFAIIFPVVAAPLFFVLKYNLRKAEKQGFAAQPHSGRTLSENIWFYAREFNLPGVLLFSAGLVIFLLPFSIADKAPHGWSSGYIIAMIVLGVVLLTIFGFHEKYLAPMPLFDFSFIRDRTVIGACLIDATYQVSYYCWAHYYQSFLMVVTDLSITTSGYVMNTFDVVSGVLLLFVGWLIRRTGRFKWLLYISVPLYIFAQGLMIYFRRPNQSVGYLVMCQIFISIGGSVFIIVEQLAILAAVDHQHVASVLALLNVVGTVGDSIGSTVSSVIWQHTYYPALERKLPVSTLWNIDLIYEDINTQLEYPVGNDTRIAIQESYGYAQTRMLATGTAVMVLCVAWTALIRNIDLGKAAQVKGVVF